MKRIGTAILFSLAMMTAISFCAFADTKIAPEDENPYRVFAGLEGKDAEALRECVYWEAGRCGCGADVLEAVVQTVFNRVLSEKNYGDTVHEVIHQRGQFVTVKYFGTERIPDDISEIIDDSISEVINGVMVLPDTEYVYFATKKQTLAKDHIWIGPRKKNGKPLKGKGMYFGRSKK